MKPRPVICVIVIAAALAGALVERGGPRWAAAEGGFLDFFVANVRDRFDKEDIAPAENVVLVEFNEKDKAEFSAWPPAPIDYIMALKKLKPRDPDVIAFSDVLKWDKVGVQFVDELQQSLVGFTQVVLAFAATTGATAESGLVGEDKEVPGIANVEGDSAEAPALSRLVFPDPRLSTQMQLGFVATNLDHPSEAPALLVARADSKIVPSLGAQMIALQSHAPYVSQRLRFGVGAGLYLGTERFIPLAQDGTVRIRLSRDITRINALDLLTPEPGEAAAKALEEKLGKNKVVILGTTPSPAETHARLAAWALALPRLKLAPEWVTWLAVVLALVVVWRQFGFRRAGAVILGLCAAAAFLGTALVVFQSSLTWWPPLLPAAVLGAGTLFCALWPAAD